jgi:hypothetical protein
MEPIPHWLSHPYPLPHKPVSAASLYGGYARFRRSQANCTYTRSVQQRALTCQLSVILSDGMVTIMGDIERQFFLW